MYLVLVLCDDIIELMPEKKMTIEDLAIMVQRGFSGVDDRMSGLENRMASVENKIDHLEADVHDIKMILRPLVKTSDTQEEDIAELKIRVNKLEDKVFVG